MHADLLTPAAVAKRLSVSRSWLYEAAKSGAIPSIRLGGPEGPVRFVEEDLEAWLEHARMSSAGASGAGEASRPTGTLRSVSVEPGALATRTHVR